MTSSHRWACAAFEMLDDKQSRIIEVSGRDRWALECLVIAGPKGCTPIDTPGPRWSAYVHNLRALGLDIETMHESHDGPFSGTHARYVLRTSIKRQDAAK